MPEGHATDLSPRDRYRRRLIASLTPEQRMERMEQLQRAAFETLAQNPQAMERFWRRNLRKRAIRAYTSPDGHQLPVPD
jgi:hypothetical protein